MVLYVRAGLGVVLCVPTASFGASTCVVIRLLGSVVTIGEFGERGKKGCCLDRAWGCMAGETGRKAETDQGWTVNLQYQTHAHYRQQSDEHIGWIHR